MGLVPVSVGHIRGSGDLIPTIQDRRSAHHFSPHFGYHTHTRELSDLIRSIFKSNYHSRESRRIALWGFRSKGTIPGEAKAPALISPVVKLD